MSESSQTKNSIFNRKQEGLVWHYMTSDILYWRNVKIWLPSFISDDDSMTVKAAYFGSTYFRVIFVKTLNSARYECK